MRGSNRTADERVGERVGGEEGESLTIYCILNTAEGEIRKHYKIKGESLECGYEFSNKVRPEASFRLVLIGKAMLSGLYSSLKFFYKKPRPFGRGFFVPRLSLTPNPYPLTPVFVTIPYEIEDLYRWRRSR